MHAFECVCVFDIFFICFFCSYLSCLFFGNASNAFSWYLNAQTFCFHCFTFFYFFFFFYYFFIFSLASPPWHPLPSLSLCCYIFEVLFIVSSSRRGTFGCTNVCVAHTGTRTQTHSHIHLTSAYNFFLMLCCMWIVDFPFAPHTSQHSLLWYPCTHTHIQTYNQLYSFLSAGILWLRVIPQYNVNRFIDLLVNTFLHMHICMHVC